MAKQKPKQKDRPKARSTAKSDGKQHQLKILRLREVEAQYLLGRRPEQIREALVLKYGEVTLGTVKNYITEVRAQWREHLTSRMDDGAAAWYFENMMADRRAALARGDVSTAAKILKDAAKLLGVDEAAAEDGATIKLIWMNADDGAARVGQ